MEPPAAVMSPGMGGMQRPSGGVAMNSGSATYYPSVPNTPGQRNYNIPGPRRASPAMPAMTAIPHSPQNINIVSPHLRPLEKSPKLTQIHIASPRVTENGGLTPVVNQLTSLSPEHPRSTFDVDPNDSQLSSSNMLPPASVTRSPHQHTLSNSAQVPLTSTAKLKKMLKSRNLSDQSPRPSVSKDRSPGRTWRKSFRAVSPALRSVRADERGITRDVNNSLHGSKGRANAAANAGPVPSWRGCGDGGQAMVAPVHEIEISEGWFFCLCLYFLRHDRSILDWLIYPAIVLRYSFCFRNHVAELSGELEMRSDMAPRLGGKKAGQKVGSYNIFNFLSWGKKKTSCTAPAMRLTDSFDKSDEGSVIADTDSIKVLDYTIKTLRYKLDQSNQKCVTAVEEVRALQSAVEVYDEKCRLLTQRCQELELQLSARRSGLWDSEPDSDNPTYIVGWRDSSSNVPEAGPQRRFSSMELTPEQFLKIFEDSKNSIRKLASSICHHIRESGESATQVITSLLEQHKVGRLISRMPRNVIILYFESFLNQVMFESFENVSFEPNGASSVFDPDVLKQTCYQSYQNLKNQEWATIEKSLGRPGALVVNTNFHRFFVVRMELILSQLGKLAENEISLNLMAAFFNAVKAVWLVHHLAFAFDQPVSIFRVSPSSEFDARFMEQVTTLDEDSVRSKVSIMVNPGFIVNRQVIKCQVYCSSKYQ